MGDGMTREDADRLRGIARDMRRDILEMGLAAGSTGIHLGGAFSCVEILAALYFDVMRFDPRRPGSPERDRLVFSKGHGAPALYAALHRLGLVADDELATFKAPGSFLTGHPSRDLGRGVDFSSGSLGQGLSLGVGCCLAMRRLGNLGSRCFVLLGDGECDEGSVWEAAMSASHYGLGNLCAVVDANGLQYDGPTGEVLSLGDLAAKWGAFGWDVVEVDGHDFAGLVPALGARGEGRPRAVIARTVKGKGASFAEGAPEWHNSRLTRELYETALAELAADERDGGSR